MTIDGITAGIYLLAQPNTLLLLELFFKRVSQLGKRKDIRRVEENIN